MTSIDQPTSLHSFEQLAPHDLASIVGGKKLESVAEALELGEADGQAEQRLNCARKFGNLEGGNKFLKCVNDAGDARRNLLDKLLSSPPAARATAATAKRPRR